MTMIGVTHRLALAAALATGLLAGCTAKTPPGATASTSVNEQAVARVSLVDRSRRQVVLQSPDGQVARVEVPDDVRNFDQIEVGDTVRLTYHSRIDVRVEGKQGSVSGFVTEAGVAGAPPGQRPAGLWAARTQRSVQIVSVDRNSHTVTFREPDGSIDSIVVQNPDNFALADGLQPGTFVLVTRTDAVAVAVEKV